MQIESNSPGNKEQSSSQIKSKVNENQEGSSSSPDNQQSSEKKRESKSQREANQNSSDREEGSSDEEHDSHSNQDEQEDQDAEDESSNIKHDSKEEDDEEMKSSSDNNDAHKRDEPSSSGGKKCFNKLCNKRNLYKKVRSKVENAKYRFLCKGCYDNYVNNSFCEFCEQIYSNNGSEEDDDRWIGCDKCDRWNHIECEKKYRNQNINEIQQSDGSYLCLTCSQKAVGSTRKTVNKKYDISQAGNTEDLRGGNRHKFQISKDQRVPIFNRKIENLPNLENYLQTYNFRLWINDNLIREDLQHLRAIEKTNGQQDLKKNKKVKTE